MEKEIYYKNLWDVSGYEYTLKDGNNNCADTSMCESEKKDGQ